MTLKRVPCFAHIAGYTSFFAWSVLKNNVAVRSEDFWCFGEASAKEHV